ncbi:hypothetical protein B0H21DRAFT_142694 [Amylocystis lapponica]|nr:hypothetical protein B0H21DRAFT_142694 [Amylocystis lapponica]
MLSPILHPCFCAISSRSRLILSLLSCTHTPRCLALAQAPTLIPCTLYALDVFVDLVLLLFTCSLLSLLLAVPCSRVYAALAAWMFAFLFLDSVFRCCPKLGFVL